MSRELRKLERSLRDIVALTNRDIGKMANKIGSEVAGSAASGRTKDTPAVAAARIRADMNKVFAVKKIEGRKRIIRVKHLLAIDAIAGYSANAPLKTFFKHKMTWAQVASRAQRVQKRASSSRAYLRTGWLYTQGVLGVAAGKYKGFGKGKGQFRRDVSHLDRAGNRLSKVKAAKIDRSPKSKAEATNLAAAVVSASGSKTARKYKKIGNKGVNRALKRIGTKEKAFLERKYASRLRRKTGAQVTRRP